MNDNIEKLIVELQNNGSTFNSTTLKKIKNIVKAELKKDQSIEECLKDVGKELQEYSEIFLYQSDEVISGLCSTVYIPNPNGSSTITIQGGKTNYQDGKEIDENTLFDLASITKLYTFLLTLKLIEKGYFKYSDKISDLDPHFINLEDYRVSDILKMAGEIKTDRKIVEGKNKEEVFQILQTTHIENKDRSWNHYTDLGLIILSKVIERIVSKKLHKEMNFAEIMDQYLLKPWRLTHTMFCPDKEKYSITGNGNRNGLVHDPKARALGGAVGSAGLFSNATDFTLLTDHLFSNSLYSTLAGTIIFPNAKENNKGYAGIYQKHKEGLKKTFVPNEYGTGSFASQGFTGSVAIFDPKNKIHNTILVNSIREGQNKKPEGFMKALTNYQIKMTEITLETYLLNKYYSEIEYNTKVKLKIKTK